jgi:acetyltransferase-like isoleucine patch superfamily enzyme
MLVFKYLFLLLIYYKEKFWSNRHVKFRGFTILFASKGSTITIGNNTTINSCSVSNLLGLYQRTIIRACQGSSILIGNNVGISGTTIFSRDLIVIGDNCKIGANCKIIDNDFHSLDFEERKHGNEIIKTKPIHIEKNCFIGMNSIILKGTVLGENCIVGAGSVVSGIFPNNVIIAGNPAIIIKTLNCYLK